MTRPIVAPTGAVSNTLARRGLLVGAGLLAAGAAIAQPSGPNPDAELIALCAEVGIHRDRFNASDLDSDDDPDWSAYMRAANAISDAKPQTMAGLVAKARAAKSEALFHETPATNKAAQWALDLADDLIRLGGRA